MDLNRTLDRLDKHALEFNFPVLDNAYVQYAAGRLSAFQGAKDWLVVFEVLGFSTQEIEFVDDLYAYGTCIEKEGFVSEDIPLTATPEQPLFEAETNQCIADWKTWSVTVRGQKMCFSPTREDYNQAGITVHRDPGPGTLTEIELLRFLAYHLEENKLFMADESLLGHFPRCKRLSKILQTTRWQHPDVAGGEKPSENVSVRSLIDALSKRTPSTFDEGHPNTHWNFWGQTA